MSTRSPGSRVMCGGDVGEQLGNGKDEVEGRAVLAKLAIDAGLDGEAGFEVEFVADDGADGAEGVEALGAGPLAVFLLQVAGGDVVGQGVAADGRAPVRLVVEIADAAADDQRQFAFEVDAAPRRRACGRCRRERAATRGLEEEQRLGGKFVAQFLDVVAIVAADADDLRGRDRRRAGRRR